MILEVLKSIFILPVTAGNLIRRRNGKRGHDGTVSSLVLIIFIISLAFVTLYVTSSSNIPVGEDPSTAVRYVLIVIIMIGIASIAVICLLIREEAASEGVLEELEVSKKPPGLRFKFLCFFTAAIIFDSILFIVLCIDKISSGKLTSDTIPNLIWNIIAIGFYTLQTILIACYRNSVISLNGSMKLHLGMMFILVADLAIWFEAVLSEKEDLDKDLNDTRLVYRDTHGVEYYNCTQVSKVDCFVHRVQPYISPVITEYCLVSVTFILQIWGRVKDAHFSRLVSESSSDLTGETSSLLGENSTERDIQATSQQYSLTDTITHNRYSVSLFVSVAIGGVMATIMIILILVFSTKVNMGMLHVWQSFRLTYNIVFLLITIAGYAFLSIQCVPDPRPRPVSPPENVLLLAVFGVLSYHICGMYAGAFTGGELGTILLAESIIDSISVYYQTVLILQANRFRRIRTHQGCSIKNIFALLVTLNLGLWVSNSFLEKNLPFINVVKVNFYGRERWDFAKLVVFPIYTFYRFTSAMAYYELYYFFKSTYVTP